MDEVPEVISRVFVHVLGAVRYEADQPGADYWQTPQETFRRGAGDCEDFALAWWWTARQWGVGRELRDVVGEARLGWLLDDVGERSHMVCLLGTFAEGGDPWVLDCLADVPHRLSERADGLHVAMTLGLDDVGRPAAWMGLGPKRTKAPPSKLADVLRRTGMTFNETGLANA